MGIWPTPPIRSMFCLMLPKKGLAAFLLDGMGQPPATGAELDDVSRLSPFFAGPSVDAIGRRSTLPGIILDSALKPPLRMRPWPFHPSDANLFSTWTDVTASFICAELASYT